MRMLGKDTLKMVKIQQMIDRGEEEEDGWWAGTVSKRTATEIASST